MPAYNKVILAGHLTRDPELRYTPKGTAVARLGLAVNREWKDDSGTKKEEVMFVDIDAFGKQAEVLGQYCKKGAPLLIDGRLKLETWEDKKTNQQRSKLLIVLESFQFLGSKEGGQKPVTAATGAAPKPVTDPQPNLPVDDDVPF